MEDGGRRTDDGWLRTDAEGQGRWRSFWLLTCVVCRLSSVVRHPLSCVVSPITTPPTVQGFGACANRHNRASVCQAPGASIMGSSYSLHVVPAGVAAPDS